MSSRVWSIRCESRSKCTWFCTNGLIQFSCRILDANRFCIHYPSHASITMGFRSIGGRIRVLPSSFMNRLQNFHLATSYCLLGPHSTTVGSTRPPGPPESVLEAVTLVGSSDVDEDGVVPTTGGGAPTVTLSYGAHDGATDRNDWSVRWNWVLWMQCLVRELRD